MASLNYYVCATFLLGVKLYIEAEGDMWHDMMHETKSGLLRSRSGGEKQRRDYCSLKIPYTLYFPVLRLSSPFLGAEVLVKHDTEVLQIT